MEDLVTDISDTDFLKGASAEMNLWIRNVRNATNSKTHEEVTKEKLLRQSKETLVKCLLGGYQIVSSNSEKFESSRDCVEQLKSELIAAQRSVVKLQQQLLDVQAEQLNTMSTVVDTAVDRGIQSYSQIVSQSIEKSKDLLKEKLKKAVQEAVIEEDRSKNVVVFGLAEDNSEDLDVKVGKLFEEIVEKPSFEAVRVGMPSDDRSRPVKVSLRNSEIVHRLLSKAKQLRATTAYRKVFISPDRSPEERAKHRELVIAMRETAKEDPDRHYYIRSGKVYVRDKK